MPLQCSSLVSLTFQVIQISEGFSRKTDEDPEKQGKVKSFWEFMLSLFGFLLLFCNMFGVNVHCLIPEIILCSYIIGSVNMKDKGIGRLLSTKPDQ